MCIRDRYNGGSEPEADYEAYPATAVKRGRPPKQAPKAQGKHGHSSTDSTEERLVRPLRKKHQPVVEIPATPRTSTPPPAEEVEDEPMGENEEQPEHSQRKSSPGPRYR